MPAAPTDLPDRRQPRTPATGWMRPAAYALLGLAALAASRPAAAAPPAGSVVDNQVTATYTEAAGTARSASSNRVQVVVGQVAGFTLASNGSASAISGSKVTFAHTLTNTGNGVDTFALAAAALPGGYALNGIALYADANGDGIADNAVAIVSTGALAAGAAFRFVVVATVPGSAAPGSSDQLRVDATSGFDARTTSVAGGPVPPNIDTATAVAPATLVVTKDFSAVSGRSPSGPYTVTLRYANASAATALAVRLVDPLPAGMVYVPGSGRWSAAGATVLTDGIDTPDDQAGGAATIAYDFGVTTAGVVTASSGRSRATPQRSRCCARRPSRCRRPCRHRTRAPASC